MRQVVDESQLLHDEIARKIMCALGADHEAASVARIETTFQWLF